MYFLWVLFMKYLSRKKGDTKFLIPVGDPPPGKIVKSDIKKYRMLKAKLTQKMSWTKENDNASALEN